jgi:hypothetical protein
MRSNELPLDACQVHAPQSHQFGASLIEHNLGDMLTMASILSALMLYGLHWISVKVKETEIIACRDKTQVVALRY